MLDAMCKIFVVAPRGGSNTQPHRTPGLLALFALNVRRRLPPITTSSTQTLSRPVASDFGGALTTTSSGARLGTDTLLGTLCTTLRAHKQNTPRKFEVRASSMVRNSTDDQSAHQALDAPPRHGNRQCAKPHRWLLLLLLPKRALLQQLIFTSQHYTTQHKPSRLPHLPETRDR
ncbi:hypothetical protein BDW22DRAFT_764889 [Trametopsis cervina]|nr:hypothetical protein BDW22DRAFT_764889 [Trametopsis cervina]